VLDGETGFLVEAGDIDALAERLARLIADPSLRQSFGRKGRRRIEEAFTIDSIARSIENLYQEIAKSN
jgi:glycosyltransferase involved in cell wall biosynthesis